MKPNQTRITSQFKYCLLELLKFLNKNAAENIVFIFTNARGTDYQLGDTGPVLNKLLKQIKEKPPYVNIDLKNKDIKYFFDNESFRYLMKMSQGFEVNQKYKKSYQESWNINVDECDRLFK